MSSKAKVTSKLATIEAARAIYFIVVGLAIKESLVVLASPVSEDRQNLPLWELLFVGSGYLITAIRFSHGIAMLRGHEEEKIKTTNLPSSKRISLISLFIVLLAISLYLMSMNLSSFPGYLLFTLAVLVTDLFLIVFSRIIRKPFRLKKGWRETTSGYQARAALQWILSDIILIILCLVTLANINLGITDGILLRLGINPLISFDAFWGAILILAGIFDYWSNRAFYFGGSNDGRKHKFVFVCSPLSPPNDKALQKLVEAEKSDELAEIIVPEQKQKKINEYINQKKEQILKKNINLAQEYCRELMPKGNSHFPGSKPISPFASHCFYTYFLDDKDAKDRHIGRQCALSFLSACDAIYVYTSSDRTEISDGMRQEIDESKKLGLEIKYQLKKNNLDTSNLADWHTVSIEEKPIGYRIEYNGRTYSYKLLGSNGNNNNDKEVDFEGNRLRKRVYVCTHLRGKIFNAEGKEIKFEALSREKQEEHIAEMVKNVRKTLWQCHELARDDKAFVAPFAPQAFFTYFWSFFDENGFNKEKWDRWFESSLEILKVCDAVYIFTEDGLPNSKDMSDGMRKIENLAESLGLEIIYKQEKPVPENWKPALPNFIPIVAKKTKDNVVK
jgi:hypothetical protein